MTKTQYTLTSKGPVDHHLLPNGVLAPVKLDFSQEQAAKALHPPLTRGGQYVYALPGGRDLVRTLS